MNPLVQLKKLNPLFVLSFAFACFALSGTVKAVSPPPDGGYPGGNTAEGQNALFSLTTGGFNTAVGFYALFANTTGYFNTALGAGALDLNTTGTGNTASGAAALLLNTTGDGNTAVGASALILNFTGAGNTAVGAYALLSNDGDPDAQAGSLNTAIGVEALTYNTTGYANTAVGAGSAENSLKAALGSNTTGDNNTAIGRGALGRNTQGGNNTAVGAIALAQNTTGSGNTVVGYFAGGGVTTASNVICIGASGANVSNSCFIDQIYSNVQPVVGTDPDSVTITSSGRLGRGNVSSRRYKHDVEPMDKVSEGLYALKPVRFRYNKDYDPTQTLAFGLIAEEVAEVYPDLVGRNRDGQPESVRYEQINAMLLNEFLKEHRTVQELNRTVAQQQKQIEALTTGLQKISAQLEVSKPVPQTVLNSQ